MGERAELCLNCGDNRSQPDCVLCGHCENHMMMGGYRGDGL